MRSVLVLLALSGISSTQARFKPADRTALTTAINACVQAEGLTNLNQFIGADCNVDDNGDYDETGTHISNWDTSDVTDMNKVFQYANHFNQPLNWDTSNVDNLASMFYGAQRFNQPLDFDTSNVVYFTSMFYGARRFNQPLDFDTSNGIYFANMFRQAYSFNQPLDFNMDKATNVKTMFYDAVTFNQPLDWHFNEGVYSSGGLFNYGRRVFDFAGSMLQNNVTYIRDGIVHSLKDWISTPPSGMSFGNRVPGTCGLRHALNLPINKYPFNGNSIYQRYGSWFTEHLLADQVQCVHGQRPGFDTISCLGTQCADNNALCCEPPVCDGLGESDCKSTDQCWFTPSTGTCSLECDQDFRDHARKICGADARTCSDITQSYQQLGCCTGC